MFGLRAKRAAERPAAFGVVLAGNPNAGKTTLFNALTRSRLKTGNFHGVTTVPFEKTVDGISYSDVPGMYSFRSYTMEEDSAYRAAKDADLIVNVVDATTLENSLNLTKNLIALNGRTVVYLTKLDALKRRGGRVDGRKLSAYLGVPVLICTPKQLKEMIESHSFPQPPQGDKISLDEAYYGGNCRLSGCERLFYNKFFALAFFVLTLTLTFFITFHPSMPGARLKGLLEYVVCDLPVRALEGCVDSPVLLSFVCEGVIGGVGGVLAFIPQITLLYLVLILLDESGISSALTFVTDGLFEKVGLSGRAAFSLVSGFGCTAAAIATTRGYSSDAARKKTIAVLPFIPCGAKMPVFLTFLSPLFKNPFPAVCALYFSGIVIAVIASAILRGDGEGLISEVTPISLPSAKTLAKKLYFQVRAFIIKVTTYVFVFCVISWLLSHLSFTRGFCAPEESILGALSRIAAYLFYPMGIRDWRIAYAALTGFAAKENVAATIALLMPQGVGLGVEATIALCVFFLTCPACISAFGASAREIGFKRTAANNLLQLAFAFAISYAVYLVMILL